MVDREVGASRELDVGTIGRALGRRKLAILIPVLLCLVGSTIGVNMVKPRYTAEAKILVENQENFFTRPDRSDAASQAPLPDDEAIQSQVQLVTSRDIARKAIRQLDLAGNPEFDPAATGLGAVNRVLVLLGLERDPLRAAAEDRLLTAFYDRLTVYPVVKSRVLSVQFTSLDPDLAARAANAVSSLYIDQQSDAKRTSAKTAADSLAALIADLKVKLAAADTKAQDFRASNGLLVGTNNTTITSQQLSDLAGQLAQARNAEAESESKAKLLRDMIRQNRITDVPDVANSELIRSISQQRILLKAQIAQLSMTLLPGHPRMRELNAQLADIDGQLRAASEKVTRSLENDSRIAAGKVEYLKAAIEAQTATATTAGTDQVRLNELEQQARLLRDQLDFNVQKYQEAFARENAVSAPADARIISRAAAPELPSFPKKLPTIAIFTLAGLVLSVGIVIARELLSGRAFVMPAVAPVVVPRVAMTAAVAEAAYAEDVRAAPPPIEPVAPRPVAPAPAPVIAEPVPVAAAVVHPEPHSESAQEETSEDEPVVSEIEHDFGGPHYSTYEEFAGPGGDLVTMLDMVADKHADGGGTRLLVLRSAEAVAEAPAGLLTLARGLARRARTILVDCGVDESLDQLLVAPRSADAPPVRGLTNLLAGDTSFAEVIHRDPMSRLHVVPFGAGDLSDVQGDYGVLIDALAETYEHVLLAVPMPDHGEAIPNAADVDLAILLVTATTPEEAIQADRDALHLAGVPSIYVLDVGDLQEPGGRQVAAA